MAAELTMACTSDFSGLVRGMLFGIGPNDVLTLLCVAFGVVVVAVLATLLPASTATRADPVAADIPVAPARVRVDAWQITSPSMPP